MTEAEATARQSAAFNRLARPIQRWVWRQRWSRLRDVQERAVAPILAGRDVVIAAATASGKTEAAFLPILTRVADEVRSSLSVLYVSPLKALINDQARRLEPLVELLDAPVTRWHGDADHTRKQRLLRDPKGVLVITPESIEALMVNRGTAIPRLFEALDYVVIDELHSFIGTERGRQLQSLLHRIEVAIGREVPRAGLSATLGDMRLASEFLRPGSRAGEGDSQVVIVESNAARREVRLQIRGYRVERPDDDDDELDNPELVNDLLRVIADGTHIVFANARADVEMLTDRMRRAAEQAGWPIELWAHHGSLSKQVREDAERALRAGDRTTVLATTSLELGIDVGSVVSIGQVGPPPSVASLRQRMGRSGRSDDAPSVIRIFIPEMELDSDPAPQSQLHESLLQAIAMVELLIKGWNEPPPPRGLHLSTLVQQLLSLCAQVGGFRAQDAWTLLCRRGPFRGVSGECFGQLLRCLAQHDLIVQDHDGTIVIGLAGERLVNHYEFYAAFSSPEEYRLVADGRTLGTLPILTPLVIGQYIIFAGCRWQIVYVDDRRKIAELVSAPGGRAPPFRSGGGMLVHDRVRKEMRAVLEDSAVPRYLDAAARELLEDARAAYRELRLDRQVTTDHGNSTVVFHWAGDRVAHTLMLALVRCGLEVIADGLALVVANASPTDVRTALEEIAVDPELQAYELAAAARDKEREKHHRYLDEHLLTLDYAASRLDVDGARRRAAELVAAG